MGKTDLAREHYQSALALQPELTAARQALAKLDAGPAAASGRDGRRLDPAAARPPACSRRPSPARPGRSVKDRPPAGRRDPQVRPRRSAEGPAARPGPRQTP